MTANPDEGVTTALIDKLLDAPVDADDTLLLCVLNHTAMPSLLALSGCSERLRRAVAPVLAKAEEERLK